MGRLPTFPTQGRSHHLQKEPAAHHDKDTLETQRNKPRTFAIGTETLQAPVAQLKTTRAPCAPTAKRYVWNTKKDERMPAGAFRMQRVVEKSELVS